MTPQKCPEPAPASVSEGDVWRGEPCPECGYELMHFAGEAFCERCGFRCADGSQEAMRR